MIQGSGQVQSKYSDKWSNAKGRDSSDRLFDRFDLRTSSLRARFALVFTGVLILVLLSVLFFFYNQHRAAVRATDLALRQYALLDNAVELRRSQSRLIETASKEGALSLKIKHRFHSLLNQLRQKEGSDPIAQELLFEIDGAFLYLISLKGDEGAPSEQLLKGAEKLRRLVDSYLDLKKSAIYKTAQNLEKGQAESVSIVFALLLLLSMAIVYIGYRSIDYITRPISHFASYLDNVGADGAVDGQVPDIFWKTPELSKLAASFEELLGRLQTYRQLNVRRLLLEKRRADIVAASILDGIYLLRGEEIVYVNPVGEKILNLPEGMGWKGLNIVKFKEKIRSSKSNHKELRDRYRGLLAIESALNSTIPVELEIRHEDRKLSFLLQTYPISEELIEQVEHSFDVSADRFLDRWQANVVVVARDITLVKESQEAKSHFIATLSHEVKTPVTSLTMATRLLKKSMNQITNSTQRTLIETCAEDVDRLRVLIDDLLSVSRFNTLTEKVEFKNVNLTKLMKQSVQHFQPQAFERGVEIVWKTEDIQNDIIAPLDAAKISWALSNLIINALRHTPRGGKVEAIATIKEKQAFIRICDHGPGIEKGKQERIFERFSSFYSLRVGRSGSTGMGLAIAREIIAAHGGRIWVVSEPGSGAEFCFTLPLTRAEENFKASEVETLMVNSPSLHGYSKGELSGTFARG